MAVDPETAIVKAVDRHPESTVGPPYIDFTTHGLTVKMLYQACGLDAYWGMVGAFEPGHEDEIDDFQAAGHEWTIAGSDFWFGGIEPPDSSDFDPGDEDDGLWEYQYQVEATDDEVGDRDITFQFRPRYPNATLAKNGNELQGSRNWPEGIAVDCISTNLELQEVFEVLYALADAIDYNSRYLQAPHPTASRITQYEMYVRIDRDVCDQKITGPDGKIREIAEYASSEATSGKHRWDNEDHKGYFRSFDGNDEAFELMYPQDDYTAMQVKGYHPKFVRAEVEEADESDPLAHPKFEVSYSSGFADGALTLADIGDLRRELREVGWNTLHWAGVDLDPRREHWIRSDTYFDVQQAPSAAARNAQITDDPLPELRDLAIETTTGEMASTTLTEERERILAVLADHGKMHAQDLADEAGVARSTAYRLLEELSILKSDNGEFSFADSPTLDTVQGILDRVQRAAEWAGERFRDMKNTAQALREDDGPLTDWMQRHGIDLAQRHPQLEFDLGPVASEEEARRLLRAGLQAADRSGLKLQKYKDALVSFRAQGRTYKGYAIVTDGRIMGGKDIDRVLEDQFVDDAMN